jgi:hypothetical protein
MVLLYLCLHITRYLAVKNLSNIRVRYHLFAKC